MSIICPILRRALLGALTLTGVAFATSTLGQQPTAQPVPWRHGVLEAKSDAGFVFMPSKGGFAEKQGLRVETMQFKGDALALKALIAGELDTYEGSPGGPMLAASNGADIKLLGCYWPLLTYGIFSKASIASPQDLKGKVMAISSPGALPDLLARAVLEKNDISSSEVRFAIMGSDADRFRAVMAGVAMPPQLRPSSSRSHHRASSCWSMPMTPCRTMCACAFTQAARRSRNGVTSSSASSPLRSPACATR
jgi:ABC-type nitrate/sulfonate/bicarbonate transport system substrate-binding protein